ncbi:hypothetical protein ACIBH1_41380 [Nonomuraea sp. NPDC050663]|uniref:hypothetical protein n=1 Tax=Nonomuraea sp. NPDC050663 TaxID=3364370 RepID=UPI0037949A7C
MRTWHKPLMAATALMALAALAFLVLYLADGRQLDGMPLWAKPLKFTVSFTLYFLTWAWLFSLRHRATRTAWWSGTVMAVFGVIEVGLIVYQAARVHRSHFNESTPLDATIWALMGITIGVLLFAQVIAAALVLIERQADPVSTWAIRLGLVISTVGIGLGALMAFPVLGTDFPEGIAGAHSVGVPDGGPGLPLVGWSTTGGDLRIPHFVGMHGLQLMPLLAMGLALVVASQTVRLRLILIAGGFYTGLLALATWQALRGQPLLEPDGLTLSALGVLLVVTLGAIVAGLKKTEVSQ